MNATGTEPKVFVVDTNLFFVKRLSEALRQLGFVAVHCSEPAYALTMIEWNMPVAVLCATSMSNAMGLEIPGILRADPKTSHIPVIAIGDRGQQSQLETLRAGYADFIDRRLGAEEIAAHVTSILSSYRDGFQPTQMLARSETALDGRLSLVDLPGVIQVLAQSRQTGGLHINADSADGIIFFDAGEIVHAECGHFAGDDAIVQVVKSCYLTKDGVYKFIPGDASALRTVQGSLNALILEAMRQLDEEEHEALPETLPAGNAAAESQAQSSEPEKDKVPTPGMEPAAAEDRVEIEAIPAPDFEGGAGTVPQNEAKAPQEIEVAPDPHGEAPSREDAGASLASQAPVGTEPRASVEGEEASVAEVAAEPPAPGPADFGSIIDAETLRGLNELLVNLTVGGTHTHE